MHTVARGDTLTVVALTTRSCKTSSPRSDGSLDKYANLLAFPTDHEVGMHGIPLAQRSSTLGFPTQFAHHPSHVRCRGLRFETQAECVIKKHVRVETSIKAELLVPILVHVRVARASAAQIGSGEESAYVLCHVARAFVERCRSRVS